MQNFHQTEDSLGLGQHAQPMAEINTTPLVDVMLVLLVIFIITAPLFTHAVKLDLPNAPAAASPEKPQTITLSINAQNEFFWDNAPMTMPQVQAKLQEVSGKKPQPELHLRADKATRYEAVAQVMAAGQSAGIAKIGFVTDPKEALKTKP